MNNNKSKIGICTLYTGYNFGSALQAFASKKILNINGYDAEILKLSGSFVEGRDIRLKKTIITLFRMFLYSKNKIKVFKSFKQNDKQKINLNVIKLFDDFYNNELNPTFVKYNELKKLAHTDNYYKFICGSDQIWNSTTFYVDPFYYLQFAPIDKRIAYAPSFGKTYIPNYNKKIIKNYLKKIHYISTREDSGKMIVKELIGKNVPVCLDPTLLFNRNQWIEFLKITQSNIKEKYILCYFLNEPNKKAYKLIKELAKKENLKVIFINKTYNDYNVIYGGPKEFLEYINSAEYIMTDSFHGVAFSVNFNKKFYVFDRNYITENQSTRIISLLKKIGLENVFDRYELIDDSIFNYDCIYNILNEERKKSISYLFNSIGDEFYE